MKAKKLVAGLLAGVMVLGSAISTVSAATIESSLTVTTFFGSRTKGVEITSSKTTISFTQTTTGTNNWDCAAYVVFSSDDGKFYASGDDGFTSKNETEFFVCRGDIWGWSVENGSVKEGNTGDGLPSGYKFTASGPEDWTTWTSALKKGVKSTITAQLSGKNAVITYTAGACKSTATIPVGSKKAYIGLTGENVKITGISASTEKSAQTIKLAKSTATVAAGKSVTVKVTGSNTALSAARSSGSKNFTIKASGKNGVKVTAKKTAKKGDKVKIKVFAKEAGNYAKSKPVYLTVTVK